MGGKSSRGGAEPRLPAPPQRQIAPGTGEGEQKARRVGRARNRTLLTQGLGGGNQNDTATQKKGLLGSGGGSGGY